MPALSFMTPVILRMILKNAGTMLLLVCCRRACAGLEHLEHQVTVFQCNRALYTSGGIQVLPSLCWIWYFRRNGSRRRCRRAGFGCAELEHLEHSATRQQARSAGHERAALTQMALL
jgi:hypothetical protein